MSIYSSLLREIDLLGRSISSLEKRAGVSKSDDVETRAKKNLKDNTYEDEKSKKEIVFSTAFRREHPKAVKDFKAEVKKLRKKKPKSNSEYKPEGQFKVEIKLALNVSFGNGETKIDIENLSLPQEAGIKSVVTDVINAAGDVPPPKKRKERSDKGVKRGPRQQPEPIKTTPAERKKRVRKALEKLPDELPLSDGDTLVLNKDALAEMTSETLAEVRDTLQAREDERVEEGQEPLDQIAPQDTPQDTPAEPAKDYSSKLKERAEGEDLMESLNATIDNMFAGERGFLGREKREKQKEPLRKMTESIKHLSKKQVESLAKSYEEQGESLIEAFKGGSDYKGIAALHTKIQEATKNGPPENPMDDPNFEYKTFAGIASKKLSEAAGKIRSHREQLEETQGELGRVTTDLSDLSSRLQSGTLTDEERGELTARQVELQAQQDLLKQTEQQNQQDLDTALNDTGIDEELVAALEQYEDDPSSFKDFADKLEKSKWMSDNLDTLQGDVDSEVKKVMDKYADQVGSYLACKAMEEGIVRDPMYGVKLTGKSPNNEDPDVQAQRRQVRINQARRYMEMTPEIRAEAAEKTKVQLKASQKQLDELTEKITRGIQSGTLEQGSAEHEELKNQVGALDEKIQALMDTQGGLNAARQIKGEEPLDGLHKVDGNLVALAGQVNDDNLLNAIAVLGDSESDREETREAMKSAINDMSYERFKQVVGDTYGEMAEVCDRRYCPSTPKNNAAGVGGEMLNEGQVCPEPMNPALQALMRDYITDSFVDTGVINKEDDRDRDDKKGVAVDKKQREEFKKLWNKNKEDVLNILTMSRGNTSIDDYDEEKVEAALAVFALELRMQNFKAIQIGNKTFKGADEILKYIRKVQEMRDEEREEQIKELAKQFEDFLSENEPVEAKGKQASIFNKSFMGFRHKYVGDFLMKKHATTYVDYQAIASDFEVGMSVYTYTDGSPSRAGIVVAVYPAIGMVDVQYPHGSTRLPVEELVIDHSKEISPLAESHISVPGGAGSYPVSLGSKKVAAEYMEKQAIYWWAKDRVYRKSKGEDEPQCPKCKETLKRSVYKRRNGKSDRLLVCTSCLFIIKSTDIIEGK